MSNYTKSTNFATKDNLSPGNPLKIVKGAEIDTEFNNIQTAVATKTDNASGAGKIVQTGYETTVNNVPFSLQKIEIQAKDGKIA